MVCVRRWPAVACVLTLAWPAQAFALASPDFDAGGAIPKTHTFDGFGCTGDNGAPARPIVPA